MWNRILGAIAGAALAFALTCSMVNVSAETNAAKGAGDAGAVDEPMRWQTVKGNSQRGNWTRSVVRVPETYGEFVCASGTNEATSLWYKDKDGVLRNVIVLRADSLVQIERMKSQ